MALTLNGIEPVEIKGVICTPKIDTETRLRLSEIKSYDKSTDLLLASAFPENEDHVRAYLETAPVIEKEILHAYLVGGEQATKAILSGFEDNMKKIMDNALEKTQNG